MVKDNTQILNIQKQSVGVNKEVTSESSQFLKSSLSSITSKVDGSDKPENISHQILAEPLAAISGTYPNTSFIGASTSTINSYLNPSEEMSSKASNTVKDGKDVHTPIKDGLKKTINTINSAIEAVSSSSSKANGKILMAAGSELRLGGNTTHIVSDSVSNIISPMLSINTQVSQTHANHVTQVYDDQVSIGKSSYREVGVDQKIATHVHTFSTKSYRTLTAESQNIATQTNEIQGKNTNIYADDNLKQVSTNTIEIASKSNTSLLSGDIYITASGTTIPSPTQLISNATQLLPNINQLIPNADPNVEAIKNAKDAILPNSGSIKIISNGSGVKKGNIDIHSTGSIYNSADLNLTLNSTVVNSVAQAMITSNAPKISIDSDEYLSAHSTGALRISTSGTSLFMFGRVTFMGRRMKPFSAINKTPYNIPSIKKIPVFPEVPTARQQSLDACIPERFKKKQFPDANGQLTQDGIVTEDSSIFDPSTFNTNPTIPNQNIANSNTAKDTNIFNPISQESRSNPIYKSIGTQKSNTTSPDSIKDGNVLKTTKSSQQSLNVPSTISNSSSPTQQHRNNQVSRDVLTGASLIRGGLGIYPNIFTSNFPQTISRSGTNSDPSVITDIIPQTNTIVSPDNIRNIAHDLNINTYATDQVISNIDNILANNVPDYLLQINQADVLIQTVKDISSYVVAIGYFGNVLQNKAFISPFFSVMGIKEPYISKYVKGGEAINKALQKDLSGLGTFSSLYLKKVRPIVDIGQMLINNPNSDFKTLVDKGLLTSVSTSITNFLPSQYSVVIPNISELITDSITNGKEIDKEALVTNIGSLLSKITKQDEFKKAADLYNEISPIIDEVRSGDILKVLDSQSASSLLKFLVGPSNAGSIKAGINIAKNIYGAFDALLKLPDLIGLMNSYQIGLLDQVNITLSCLDLINKFKSVMDSIKNFPKSNSNRSDLSKSLENLPRMVQIVNTINNTPDELIDQLLDGIDEDDVDIINQVKTLNLSLDLDGCYRIPKLTLLESSVDYLSIDNDILSFSMTYPDITSITSTTPNSGDVIRVNIDSVYRNLDMLELFPHQSEDLYFPSSIDFQVLDYDSISNIGIAVMISDSTLLLEDQLGYVYQYQLSDIGKLLTIIPLDSYLLL